MTAISDFSDRVNAKFDQLGKGIDGVAGDVAFLKDEIAKMQNSSGTISPEDQASLDAIEARVGGLSDRVTALDALTETPPAP